MLRVQVTKLADWEWNINSEIQLICMEADHFIFVNLASQSSPQSRTKKKCTQKLNPSPELLVRISDISFIHNVLDHLNVKYITELFTFSQVSHHWVFISFPYHVLQSMDLGGKKKKSYMSVKLSIKATE